MRPMAQKGLMMMNFEKSQTDVFHFYGKSSG